MKSVKIISTIIVFYIFIFCNSCGINGNIRRVNEKIENNEVFINLKKPKGSVIQNDTSQFVITFYSPTTLKYYNSNFGRGSFKNYQFEIILQNILEKPLCITVTNYYGFLQFDWILEKKNNQYVLQMMSNIKKGFVIDEFRFKKTGKYYSLDMVYNITPIDSVRGQSNQVCFLSPKELNKDTIDCTIDKFTICRSE